MPRDLPIANQTPSSCGACRSDRELPFALTMAFQPMVDVKNRSVFAYEALVRGEGGLSAAQVLSRVNEENRYVFDQQCRVKAIELAARLGIHRAGAKLSVNFMPGAVYSPAACIRRTLEAAREFSFPLDAIIFEITENEQVTDSAHLQRIAEEYARHGFRLALDDFGAGFSGLNLLAELAGIHIIKLDAQLIRGIERNGRAKHLVAAMVEVGAKLGVAVLAEAVETHAEYAVLRECGVDLMQGYLFARPALELLPKVTWPEAGSAHERNAESMPVAAPQLQWSAA